jgi:hypothetical protein
VRGFQPTFSMKPSSSCFCASPTSSNGIILPVHSARLRWTSFCRQLIAPAPHVSTPHARTADRESSDMTRDSPKQSSPTTANLTGFTDRHLVPPPEPTGLLEVRWSTVDSNGRSFRSARQKEV